VIFNANCERCGDLLIRGKVFNYSGKKLCEDCYVLLYLFDREAPAVFLPNRFKATKKNVVIALT